MPETIVCPECKRRLVLPDGQGDNVVQCPSCGTRFRAGAAWPDRGDTSPSKHRLPATGPDRRPASDPRHDESRTEDELATRLTRKRSTARRPWGILWAWLGAIALFVGGGSLLVFVSWGSWSPGPTSYSGFLKEDEEERLQDLRDAFGDQKPMDRDELVNDLKPLFEGLGQAFRAADGPRIMSHYDVDRMADEFAALGVLPNRSTQFRRSFAQSLRKELEKSLVEGAVNMEWNTFEIRHVKRLNANEAVVIARHEKKNAVTLKMRWWVIRQPGGFKVYDTEDLDAGTRFSAESAVLLAGGERGIERLRLPMKTLREAVSAITIQNDFDAADRKLKSIANVEFPDVIAAQRLMWVGTIHLRRGEAKEAIEALEKAADLHPGMAILDHLLASAYIHLGQWDKALKHIEKYRELLGEDASVCSLRAGALQGLERFDEAAVDYRKSLDFDPTDAVVFHGFLRSVGNDDKMDVGPRFAKIAKPHEHFEALADDCEVRKTYDMLESLALAMRDIDPKFTPVDFYRSLGKARAGEIDDAVTLYKSALAGQKDAAKRQSYTSGFLAAMASAHHYADAYAAVEAPRDAFRFLAPEAMKTYRTDELKRLVEAHEKKDAGDPLLPLYQAQIQVNEGQYAAAEKSFARGLALSPDALVLESFRASRVLARYYTGSILSAYREIGPRKETFGQLAELAYYANEDARLRELLDAHALKEPDSTDLLRYRIRTKVRDKELPQALALFRTALARKLPAKERTDLISEFLRDMTVAGMTVEGYKAAPDADQAFREVADDLMDEDRYADLRKLVEAHRAARPADGLLALYQGEVHIYEAAWDEAEAVLKEGMKKAPKDLRERFRPRLVLAAYRGGKGLQVYAEAEPRDSTFSQLTYLFAEDKKGAELQSLIEAHRPHATPAEALTLLAAEIRAKVFLKKTAEAVALFQKATKDQPDENLRKNYVYHFLKDMEAISQSIEGYRAAPDKHVALETLAPALVFQKKDRELTALLDEHAKGHADEPLLRFFRGESFLLRGDPKQADPHFAAAFAKVTPADGWRFRNGLFRARVKLKKAAATYQEVEPGARTFEELAQLCLAEKDVLQLQALIDAHRKAHPKDETLPTWDLEASWLKQDFEGILKRVAEHREGAFDRTKVRSKVADYQIRSLVRLKRPKDAIREAERLQANAYERRLLLVLAHASTSDAKETLAVLEKMRPEAYFLRNCYDDADLGPLLRSEPFGKLREKFPAPKEKGGIGAKS